MQKGVLPPLRPRESLQAPERFLQMCGHAHLPVQFHRFDGLGSRHPGRELELAAGKAVKDAIN
jgi:hypothetical protein